MYRMRCDGEKGARTHVSPERCRHTSVLDEHARTHAVLAHSKTGIAGVCDQRFILIFSRNRTKRTRGHANECLTLHIASCIYYGVQFTYSLYTCALALAMFCGPPAHGVQPLHALIQHNTTMPHNDNASTQSVRKRFSMCAQTHMIGLPVELDAINDTINGN